METVIRGLVMWDEVMSSHSSQRLLCILFSLLTPDVQNIKNWIFESKPEVTKAFIQTWKLFQKTDGFIVCFYLHNKMMNASFQRRNKQTFYLISMRKISWAAAVVLTCVYFSINGVLATLRFRCKLICWLLSFRFYVDKFTFSFFH